jgi:hypothetical protein
MDAVDDFIIESESDFSETYYRHKGQSYMCKCISDISVISSFFQTPPSDINSAGIDLDY